MRRALAAAVVAAFVVAARADDPPKGPPDAGVRAAPATKTSSKAKSHRAGAADGGSRQVTEREKGRPTAEQPSKEAKPCEEVKPCAIE